MIERIKLFLSETIWRLDFTEIPLMKRLVFTPIRFFILVIRAYIRDFSSLHASALTYITMLAIVPVLALGLTSLKAFGAGELAQEKIMDQIEVLVSGLETAPAPTQTPKLIEVVPAGPTVAGESQPVVMDVSEEEVSAQAASALRNICITVFEQINAINFATIGTIGAVGLVFMVVSVLGKIENSFNAIWGLVKARSIFRKLTDYLSVIIIVPLLALAATSLPILDSLSSYMPNIFGLRTLLEAIGVFKLIVPLFVGSVLFAFLFSFVPNTKVKISSAFVGAVITVILLMIFFRICLTLQVGVANNGRIYGSLVALPILLFWINSSWQIILFGAEICYVYQHRAELVRETAFSHPSERDTIVLALALTLWAGHCIDKENKPLSVDSFCSTFKIPSREAVRVASILGRSQILVPVNETDAPQPTGYVLSRCATRLKISDVINACLDDTAGEDVIRCAEGIGDLKPLSILEKEISETLSKNFDITIQDALLLHEARKLKASGVKA